MSRHRYRNPWHKPFVQHYGPEFFETSARPINYRGFQIFNRFKGCHELVKDGICLTQRVGGGALRSLADALLGDKSDHDEWLVERARQFGAAHGVSFDRAESAQ